MTFDWNVFHKAFNAADQETKDLMTSTKIYDCVAALLASASPIIDRSQVMSEIGYHLLQLQNREETLDRLSGLNVPDVYNFLRNVLQNLKVPGTPNEFTETPLSDLSSEIQETENFFAQAQGIRTMAGDISVLKHTDTPIYQSSQTEILRQAPLPTTPTAHTPRWETDT